MRGSILAWCLVGACGFSPTPFGAAGTDAAENGGSASGSDMGSGTGSGMGSGSGSGTGSATCDSDSDGDGVCDAVDDWPCGAKPNAPGNFNYIADFQFTDDNVELNNQNKTLLVVPPNQQFSVRFDYQFTVPCQAGSTCKVQIEVGTQAGKQGCGDEKDVQGAQVLLVQIGVGNGTANANLSIGTPGVYKILATPYKASSCGTGWGAGSTPDDHQTVGLVCVH